MKKRDKHLKIIAVMTDESNSALTDRIDKQPRTTKGVVLLTTPEWEQIKEALHLAANTCGQSEEDKSGEFSVCQFFKDGTSEYVRRYVDAEEAVKAAHFYTHNVAARMGLTQKVIITDAGNCTNFEWQFGKGVVFK